MVSMEVEKRLLKEIKEQVKKYYSCDNTLMTLEYARTSVDLLHKVEDYFEEVLL